MIDDVAFGQVWEWGGTKMMMICPVETRTGSWLTITLVGRLVLEWGGFEYSILREPKPNGNYWKLLSEAP